MLSLTDLYLPSRCSVGFEESLFEASEIWRSLPFVYRNLVRIIWPSKWFNHKSQLSFGRIWWSRLSLYWYKYL